ncbi:2-dehydro-3-deoxygalactonokinase [Pseudooceanicola nanhaiensis]|uniref:2-dehydro-3-deoxygalactonokinase n=1 Tax=Pseudooceanicola nanhaiensis TaxID=375761 RepID=UPI0040581830
MDLAAGDGEETQIAGFLAAHPGFDGVICLPGTHTKWVHISAGEIVSFRTFLTGELFALLSTQSVLRHSVGPEDWDAAAFAEGATDAMTAPQELGSRLFSLRAGSLLDGTPPAACRARLSGLLIVLELAGARSYWLGREIAIVGAAALAGHYRAALAGVGADARLHPGEELALAGLARAWQGARS